MIHRRGPYLLFAVLATGPLVACGDPDIFARIAPDVPAEVKAAEWPQLADVPPAPPLGVHTPATPDPALGDATLIDLAVAADEAALRRDAVAGPVK